VYSIVDCGGFQFKVSEGDVIQVPHINADKEAEITIDKVLMTVDGDKTKVGTPTIAGASVKATVVDHIKGPKVFIFKKRRRKDYRRKTGHRQLYTKIKIVSVSA
jgi:large subunit ribosomal protein L21